MKSLKTSLALMVAMGLSSVALADQASGGNASDPCCGHGLLSKLKLHRCSPCAEAPKPCATACDPCGGCGHKLLGMLKCIQLPKLHGCCKPACKPACEPKPCAPKCAPVCNPCGGCGILSKLKGLLPHGHGCGGCAKPACGDCCGHKLDIHRLLGKRCGGCCEASAPADAAPAAPAPAPAPAPKPMPQAGSSGLLILTPAG